MLGVPKPAVAKFAAKYSLGNYAQLRPSKMTPRENDLRPVILRLSEQFNTLVRAFNNTQDRHEHVVLLEEARAVMSELEEVKKLVAELAARKTGGQFEEASCV